MREAGYYWVKVEGGSVIPEHWEVEFYDGNMWRCHDAELTDNYFIEINETRILSPDEYIPLDHE